MKSANSITVKNEKCLWRIVKEQKYLLLLFAPVLIYYIVFAYAPMFGLVIAFKDYKPFIGILESPWIGVENFVKFFQSHFFTRVVRNTFTINLFNLIFSFPAPIILAILLNEVKRNYFKRFVQTVTYLPYFISIVVVVGILQDIVAVDYGIVNRIIAMLGGEQIRFMTNPEWFKSLYIASGIWQSVGWGSIIYLAAIDGIDTQIYEAANMDGANRFQNIWHITLPSISNTIIIILILQIGNILNVGFEKIILMYNTSTMESADVISTYVYRVGLISGELSFGAAVGLFNSVVNCTFLILANTLSQKFTQKGLF